MHIVRIKPSYFRGFGDGDWINFDSALVVMFGPNGFGKTSIAEAIEWLLYGKTKRRERGEALSQRDYQGSYRNAHAPSESPTYIDAVIRLADGTEHSLRRELRPGARGAETSRTLVDGNAASFTTIGLSDDEVYNPVVAQDSLQDFIHSKPKDRRDKISAALGLDPLVRFKTAVDRARTRFQSDPSQTVRTAQVELRRIAAAMAHSPRVNVLGSRWAANQFNLDADHIELQQAVLDFLGLQTGDLPTIIRDLQSKRTDAVRRVFDDAPIRVPQDIDARLAAIEDQRQTIPLTVTATTDAFNILMQATVSQYSQAQLRFWETGLGMYEALHADLCPLCEAETFTETKRAALRQRIEGSGAFSAAVRELQQLSQRLARSIRRLSDFATNTLPGFLSDAQRASLIALFEHDDNECKKFLATHDTARAAIQQTQQTLLALAQGVEMLQQLAERADTVNAARESLERLGADLDQAAQNAVQFSKSYSEAYQTFRAHLECRIASAAVIREIDGLLAPINSWGSVQVVAEYVRLLGESLNVLREVEEYIKAQQEILFATRGQEINRWYDLMNPGALVRYSCMEAATDNLLLWAETFGVKFNAAACLSQCQLNCLGLSIHFVRALTRGTPFALLLLDDPVQSMDDQHTQALVIDVIQKLLDLELQIIILSHVQGLADQIWENYYHLQPLRLRISEFQQTGPIIEDAETLQNAISRAKTLAHGNEDNRRLAVKVLRRSVELFIRALCLHANSVSPPTNATASNMLPFFRNCPNTTPPQAQGLQDTINFSNPATHTQVGYPVPVDTQIIPHVRRIERYAQVLDVN